MRAEEGKWNKGGNRSGKEEGPQMEQSTFFLRRPSFRDRRGGVAVPPLFSSLPPSPAYYLGHAIPIASREKKTKAGRRRRRGYAKGRREIRIKSPITVLYSLRRSPFRVCHEANPLLFSFFLPMRPLFFFSSIVEPRPREEARRANECFPGHPRGPGAPLSPTQWKRTKKIALPFPLRGKSCCMERGGERRESGGREPRGDDVNFSR